MIDPARLQEMRTEWETERKMLLRDMARIRGELRAVEHRLKVFFAWEGDHG